MSVSTLFSILTAILKFHHEKGRYLTETFCKLLSPSAGNWERCQNKLTDKVEIKSDIPLSTHTCKNAGLNTLLE